MRMVDVYVGLGSNVFPVRHLHRAVEKLTAAFGLLAGSNVYRNPPVGFEGDDFLNMVVRFASAAGADRVEASLSAIEEQAGRRRPAARFGPRTLDLDLLLYGRTVDPSRRLPRADVARYAFVAGPLAELEPGLGHPLTGVPITVHWEAMQRRCPRLENLGPLGALSAEACGA